MEVEYCDCGDTLAHDTPFPGEPGYVVKDSGARQEYGSGMRRDIEEDKPDLTYLVEMEMAERYCYHLAKGAKKYGRNNWQLANSQEEIDRFGRSLLRHVWQYLAGEVDEDHTAAIIFNVDARERAKRNYEATN